MLRYKTIMVAIGISLLATACTYRSSPRIEQATEQLAYVTGSLDFRNVMFSQVFIIAVDGKRLKFWQNQVAVTPGSHRFTVGYRYRDPGDHPTRKTTIAFTAIAGRDYRLEYYYGQILVRDRNNYKIIAQQRLP
ncbi:conserved hypothetical protein [Nitrosococcus halophilus Nc 4]|uniref:Lipoprotein n=1 Tax=Nitrosococcus halophilus (strain Nc4) TaxID=472759 RepID=D5BZI1_NITHN|nr:hypothetical protein [Nitrosococcus halophilus]ADE16195.1 conserved hypothetical protein [Nitrosococcus halophilus Nc 4]